MASSRALAFLASLAIPVILVACAQGSVLAPDETEGVGGEPASGPSGSSSNTTGATGGTGGAPSSSSSSVGGAGSVTSSSSSGTSSSSSTTSSSSTGGGAVCGNGTCEMGETCQSCSADCDPCPPVCGNGTCEMGETCQGCSADCGPCGPVCGNGSCEAGETCGNCTNDCCGTCYHSPCQTGIALDPFCDSCVDIVCFLDDYCCYVSWDSYCTDEASSYCGCP